MLLIVTQVYVPDPASLGQHMHDAAAELVRRGHRVRVYTARTGYDDPTQRYPRHEVRDGVEIRRLALSSFGKRSMAMRLVGGTLFLIQATLRAVMTRGLAGVIVSTSPPIAPLTGLVLRLVRRMPFVFWVMDINPDQMIALGYTRPGSVAARAFDAMIRAALRRAAHVIALDGYMEQRLCEKVELGDRVSVTPPWPLEDHLTPTAHDDNPFREEHGLRDKFVIMYSGNLSPAHPLTTVLEAAKRLRDELDVVFMFIGGGLGRGAIERFVEHERLENVRLLPYQPLDRLRWSLSAADVHLVAMGEPMVGIVHPCKIYGAMAVARPVLLLGPGRSHAGEIVEAHGIGWQVDHGDVDGAVAAIGAARDMRRDDPTSFDALGQRARAAIDTALSKATLCSAVCDLFEEHLAPAHAR